MPQDKEFFVYEMKPVKDAGSTTGDGTGATLDATARTTVRPTTAPDGTSELDGSTSSNPATAAPQFHGISMVQGPSIRGLDIPLPESIPTTSPSSAAHSHSVTPVPTTTSGSSPRYLETTSTIHRQALNEATDYSLGITTNDYILESEVQHYVGRRDFYGYYPGVERDYYDYISERNDLYNTNLVESTAHMIKGSIGAAVLSMHEAYMMGGLWTSLAVTIVVGILVGYTMIMLISSAQKMYRRIRIHRLSYPALAEAAAATAPWSWIRNKSKTFRYTVEVSLFLHLCGSCCIYQIVIAHSIRQLVDGFHSGSSAWLTDIRMYILITTPLLLPICLIRSIKVLAPFALIADIFVAICVFSTLYYCLLAFEAHIDERAAWKNLHGFFRVCGICMYGTSGICFALPVENNMKSPRYFPYVVRYAMVIVILLTAMTGFFGYWAWGENCRSPITVHMPLNIFTTILQFLLVMMLSTTFAVNFWVPFRIVWHYIIMKHKKQLPCWERIYRVLMAIVIMVVAMVATHMITVMIFLGQFFLGFVALVFPAFIEFVVDWEEHYASRARVRFAHNVKNFGLVCLGLILSLSTIYSVRDIH